MIAPVAFHHVVLFRWKPDTSPEQIAPIKPALDALAATLDGVVTYRCGAGLGLTETSYDFGVVGIFEDRAAWDAYMANNEHDRIRSKMILPIAAERAGIQFDDSLQA
jgi:hypothetical protein